MRPALTIPSAALTAFINPDRVRARAFEIFLERGDGPGDATSDWCRAERELRLSAARGSA